MIPVWIIDELTRRQEEERRRDEQKRERLELPVTSPSQPPRRDDPSRTPSSGTVVIDIWSEDD
jgi:hypothetical protein